MLVDVPWAIRRVSGRDVDDILRAVSEIPVDLGIDRSPFVSPGSKYTPE
jgi:hypothetical protein